MLALGLPSVVQESHPAARGVMRLSHCSFEIISWNAYSQSYRLLRMGTRGSAYHLPLEEAKL